MKAKLATTETANAITANIVRVINMTPKAVAYRINNGKGLCVRAVIEKLKFKYRTNDK